MAVRPGVDIQSESEHTSCPEESSAHPRAKDPQETVAGRAHLTPAFSVCYTLLQQIIT